MILTVEVKIDEEVQKTGHISDCVDEVAISFDEEGLELLLERISSLKGKKDHLHMMTPSWAGDELTEECQGGEKFTLVNHLRIVSLGS